LPKELSDVSHPQAPHQIEPVHLDRPHADLQMVGDFTVRESLRHQAKDFLLTRG
jgi:hypothetical protein